VELLLFDFDLKIGDTFVSALNKQESQIIKIDTLPDGRKIFECYKSNTWGGKCGNGFIIEGIGNNGGLLEVMPCDHTGLQEYSLICYAENNELVYSTGLTHCKCDVITAIDDILIHRYLQRPGNSLDNKIFIYPIPAKGEITVDPGNIIFLSYEIYNLSGNKIEANAGITSQGAFSVNISKLNKGIYLLKLIGLNYTSNKKIIVE
jgi:hypothetical protein